MRRRGGELARGLVVLGGLCGLGLWPLRAEPPPQRTGASLTIARLSPSGAAGRLALLGGELPDSGAIAAAVREQGFFAGEPLGSGDCASCHAEIAAQWAQSAHRFASLNNPYYTASLEQLRRERGAAAARFCAGCHDPLLLVDDAIARPALPRQAAAAQAGLPCLVCHSIKECQGTLGNGAYTLVASAVPPPAAQATAGTPSPHGLRLRAPVLKTAELCAACHKVGLLPEVTRAQWLRGQNDYDAWQQSLAAGNGVAAIYRPQTVEVKRCQDCHMPLVKLRSGQRVRSHLFLAANTALAALRDDGATVERTREFLRGAVSLDLVVLPRPTGAAEPAPTLDAQVSVRRDQPLRFDVVLRNRRVGHRFPGGTNDSNDVWLEVEVRAPGDGAALRDATHRVRAQAVDERGAPLQHRDPQRMRGVVYDTSVAPADPQVVRYKVELSALPAAATATELVLRAVLRYRKFSPEYARFACAELPASAAPSTTRRCLEPPVVEIASAERRLLLAARPAGDSRGAGSTGPASTPAAAAEPLWQRYLDHGLGLADGLVEKASEAQPSLERAAALAPERPEPLLGLARLALALGRTQEVLALCARARGLRRDHPATLWLPALALYRTYRSGEARPYVEELATMLPTDRSVLTLLARVRGLTGEPQAALAAADRLLQVDAESEDGHHQRLLALRELGRPAEAAEAERRYLYYRRPVEQDQSLRQQFRAREPARVDEDVLAHTHTLRLAPGAP